MIIDDPETPDVDESQPGFSSLYIRKSFNVDSLGDVEGLALSIDYDDAFIAYLNGEEVARFASAPTDEIVPFDALSEAQREANGAQIFGIPEGIVRLGDNVIAIQGFNATLDSSDFSLIPELVTGVEIPRSARRCSPARSSLERSSSRGRTSARSGRVSRSSATAKSSPSDFLATRRATSTTPSRSFQASAPKVCRRD